MTAAARKRFDQAMTLLDRDPAAAGARFREATEIDPSMADAWLGRIAAGDESLTTVQQLYMYGSRLHRETNRLGVQIVGAHQSRSVPVDFGGRVIARRAGAGQRTGRCGQVRGGRHVAARSRAAGYLGKSPVAAIHRRVSDVRHAAMAGRNLGCGSGFTSSGHHHVGSHGGNVHVGGPCRRTSRPGAGCARLDRPGRGAVRYRRATPPPQRECRYRNRFR